MEWTTVTVTIPTDQNDRCGELAKGSGVSLDGFVAASMEIRIREHQGKSELNEVLATGARKFDTLRADDGK